MPCCVQPKKCYIGDQAHIKPTRQKKVVCCTTKKIKPTFVSHFSFSVMSETSDFYARMESNIALLPKLVESVSDVRASVSDVRASVTVVEERTKVISDRLDGVASLVLEHEAKLQALHTNRTETDKRLETLEQQLAELRNTQAASVTVTQQLQAEIHDIYAAAAARNKEFLSVFLFMLCYGFDTTKGRVCGVFATVNNVPCVCVNLRALNVIAKMYLACPSYAKRFPDLPSFGLFRIKPLPQQPGHIVEEKSQAGLL
ncbi:MAG: hypothetical protein EBU92_13310 [Betaproteobacteria bacterium]|nr:hypothetical protein [Betaproteobacteria bacterium]